VSAQVIRNTAIIQSSLGPWDAHILELEVSPYADYISIPLYELRWREQYGINIVYIKRGEKLIHAPGRDSKLLPFDRVGILSTDEQMQVFKPIFDRTESVSINEVDSNDIALQAVMVDEHTKLKGLNIRNSGLRERTDGLVIGIERQGKRILNPDSTTVFEWGDIVWVVGVRKKIQQLTGDAKQLK
jgi:CPA2 family monovalent cation:H+ antiporter-2